MNLACLFEAARTCLQEPDPDAKVQLTLAASADWRQGRLAADASGAPDPSVDAGRPERPALVHFSRLPKRSLHQAEGRINLIHALRLCSDSVLIDYTLRYEEVCGGSGWK